jgi:hypothetical protein
MHKGIPHVQLLAGFGAEAAVVLVDDEEALDTSGSSFASLNVGTGWDDDLITTRS